MARAHSGSAFTIQDKKNTMRRLSTFAIATGMAVLAACVDQQPTGPTDSVLSPAFSADAADRTPNTISLEKIGEYSGGGEGAAEITAFDPVSKRVFVVNGALGTVDVLDLQQPSMPVEIATLSVAQFGASANSVAAHNGVVAVAVEAHTKTDPGTVAFYRATTLDIISSVTVGALPDMVTFSASGRHLLVANEGEPNDDYTVDPEGSVSIIDVSNINKPTVRTTGFGSFNGQISQLRAAGVRIYGPNASVAQDLEPEYVAVAEDGRTAYVTLQENNAFATIDIASASVTSVVPFGYKDHSRAGNGIDASDRDDVVNIRTWPVLGMYQPDGIASYSVDGRTYLVTANEGDARAWEGDPGFEEEARVNSLALDPEIFPDELCGGSCTGNSRLGRLTVTNQHGQNPETGLFEQLYVFGARSFSIWRANGHQVWDSGDQLEQRTTDLPESPFNASNDNSEFDNRSDNKGPEPEGVVLGKLGAKTFAFIGLERIGGVIVYDVSNPSSPDYVTYVNTRQGTSGDLGPEGLAFVPAVQSPSKTPLLIVGNEISGTTAIFQISLH
jgi:DNA-binding beta-propeller fold protein YncE